MKEKVGGVVGLSLAAWSCRCVYCLETVMTIKLSGQAGGLCDSYDSVY